MYLVDTSIIIDYTREREEAVNFLEKLSAIIISAVTIAEVYRGARNKRELHWLEQELGAFDTCPVTEVVFEEAINLVKDYALSHGLHILDAVIATTALQKGFTLTTLNTKHFEMIKGLTVQRPY